jgi:putative ABC transport system permease protein
MTQNIASFLSALAIFQFLGGPMTERIPQDAAAAPLVPRDPSLRAATCVTLSSKRPDADRSQPNRVLEYGLKYDDLDRLVAKVPAIKMAVPIREIPRQLLHLNHLVDGCVVGTTHEYAAFARLEIDRGRFLTPADDAQRENYAVIAAGTAHVLFPEEDPIGQTIKCGSDYYIIVGVTKWIAGMAADGDPPAVTASDMDVYIPLNTCRLRMGHRLIFNRRGVQQVEELQLSHIVVQVRDGSKREDAAALIRSAIKPFHPKDDVSTSIGGMISERPPNEREPAHGQNKVDTSKE